MDEKETVKQIEQPQKRELMKEIKKLVENELEQLTKIGIQSDNIDNFGKLIDIHKDIENECYWDVKKEGIKMRYSDYDERKYGMDDMYGADEYGEGYGNYGRRGVPGTGRRRYRGPYGHGTESEEMMDRMKEHFGDYEYSKEEFGKGNYGAKGDTMKSLEYMLQSATEFIKKLQEEAETPEEVQLVKKYAKKIGMM